MFWHVVLNSQKLGKIGILFILLGLCIPICSLPFSSAFKGEDSFIWRIIRAVWTGEIILRDGVIGVIPDRDEQLYGEYMEFRSGQPDAESVSEDVIVERFYNTKYKDLMPRVAFNLKLQKKQVVTVRKKISLPNLYVFIAGFLLVISGIVIRIYAGRRNSLIKKQPSDFSAS